PEAVSEALALLSEMGDEAAVLAGGMTLGPMLNLRMVRPRAVIDISRIQALKAISARSDVVMTGAGVVQGDALRSDVIARAAPLLVMALPWVGHFQTRNRGTLGGSVAHADPSAEIPLALVVCGGTVVLQSRRRQRRVPAREFFLGTLTTQRRPDEIVTALEWPRAAPDAGHAFTQIAQRHGGFAIAGAGRRPPLAWAQRGRGGGEPAGRDRREELSRPPGRRNRGQPGRACRRQRDTHGGSLGKRRLSDCADEGAGGARGQRCARNGPAAKGAPAMTTLYR